MTNEQRLKYNEKQKKYETNYRKNNPLKYALKMLKYWEKKVEQLKDAEMEVNDERGIYCKKENSKS